MRLNEGSLVDVLHEQRPHQFRCLSGVGGHFGIHRLDLLRYDPVLFGLGCHVLLLLLQRRRCAHVGRGKSVTCVEA